MTNMKATKRAILSSVLATVLCFAMLAGTTFAWFTDTVTSEGNIIQTGSLEVGMYWAKGTEDPATATWTDASEGPMYTADILWEPGYADAKHIKIVNEGNLALNYKLRIVADGIVGKLADVIDVYYFENASQYANRTDAFANATRLGTLTEVLGTEKNLSKTIKGQLLPEDGKDVRTLTLVLVMQTSAGEEYENTSLGCEFNVELIATQASYEEDSYGPDYDLNVPDPAIPAALVRPLENLTIKTDGPLNGNVGGVDLMSTYGVNKLDTAYKFEPTISLAEVQKSQYRYWHADFYVYADKDVEANAIALAGYYDAWCQYNDDKWIALVNDGLPVKAGEENGIRLVGSMGGGNITVNWEEICQYGNDGKGFQCGAVALDDSLNGTTLTVELRLYETTKAWDSTSGTANDETGEFITVGEFKYTFCDTEVATADDLKNAIANGAKGIRLTEDVVLNDSPITVPADGQLTIDLNGKTLSGVATNASSSNLIKVSAGASLTLTGGGEIVFGATTPDTNWGGVGQPAFPGYANNTISCLGELIIDGVTVKNVTAPGGASYAIDCYQGSNLVINSGVIDGVGKCAIRMFCNSNTLSTNVTINGGTITGKRAIWVQLPGNNINNVRPVNLTINGGEFICTSDADVCIYSYSYGDSFANTNITITGGTFTGDVCFGGGNAKTTQENVTVTGGTFNGELGRYLENDGWVDIAKP